MIAKLVAVVILGLLLIGGIFVGIPYASYMAEPNNRIEASVTTSMTATGETPVQLNASIMSGRGGFGNYLGRYWASAPDPDIIGEWKVQCSVAQLMESGAQKWLFQESRVFTNFNSIDFSFSVIVPDSGYFQITATLFTKGSAGLLDAQIGEDQVILDIH